MPLLLFDPTQKSFMSSFRIVLQCRIVISTEDAKEFSSLFSSAMLVLQG